MTWEELKEEAEKMGYDVYCDYVGDIIIEFFKDGKIMVEGSELARDRTPSQMLAIMKALQ